MDKQPDIIFTEKQKFGKWVHLIIFAILFFPIAIFLVTYKNDSIEIIAILPILLSAGIPLILEILFIFLKLETKVCNNGLYVRLFPAHIKFRKFTPEEISKAFARKYEPISEYGGWGIKGWRSNNKAYNTRGNEGVQLVFKNGKKLLIGSQKPKELENAINSIMRN